MKNLEINAGEMLKIIAKENNCKTNRELYKKIGFSYEVVNRSLRNDALLSENFLKSFFSIFEVSYDLQKEIRLKVALAKADVILKEEFLRLQKRIEILEKESKISKSQKIMNKAFKLAIKEGLVDALKEEDY